MESGFRKSENNCTYELCPSILSADFNRLGEQLKIAEAEGIRVVHIDVMDGDFVPSISFGMPVIRSIRRESGLFFDVHLMIKEPLRYIQEFVSCGADSITVHVEACSDAAKTLKAIKDAGVQAGISIKPGTPVSAIRELLPLADLVLVMTVEPGFGGQKYIPECTDKIREVRKLLDEKGLTANVQVDGGINYETARTVIEAGANYLVAGSTVFNGDMKENISGLKARIDEVVRSLA